VRVLATFPKVSDLTPAGDGPAVRRPACLPDTVGPRTIRRTEKPRFPTASILALGLLAAACWGLAALREITAPQRPASDTRLAVEPAAGTDPGTTR